MPHETPITQQRSEQLPPPSRNLRLREQDIARIDTALRAKQLARPLEERDTAQTPKERLARMRHEFLEQLAAPEFLYLQIEEIVPFAEPTRRAGEAATGRTIEGEELTKRQRIASGALGAIEAVLEACHIPTTPTHLVHWLETFSPQRAPLLHAMGSFYAEHAQPRIILQSQVGARVEAGERREHTEAAQSDQTQLPDATERDSHIEGALPEALTERIAALRALHADEDALELWEHTWSKMTAGAQKDLLGFLDAERALLEQEPTRPS